MSEFILNGSQHALEPIFMCPNCGYLAAHQVEETSIEHDRNV